MQSLSTALAALQAPIEPQEPKSALSPTLQRGLTVSDGKMTLAELQHAQTAHNQQLTPEVASSVLSCLRRLNSCKKVEEVWIPEHPEYPNGVWTRRWGYNLPEGASNQAYRSFLIEAIRPADTRLITMLLTQLMAEKPFFDADQSQIKYRLQQLTSDLQDYPYLAIWLGIDDVRTQNIRRGFPETAEILKEVRDWSEYIADAFQFLAYEVA